MAVDTVTSRLNGSEDADERDGGPDRRSLGDELRTLGDLARDLSRDTTALAQAWLPPNPYAALAVAAGVGYVLGGGLPHLLVRRMASLGGRMVVDLMLARLLGGVGPARDAPPG